MVYSPLDALKIARQNPDRQVVFMAIGFETTAPSTAMTVLRAEAERASRNFSVFCNHVTIIPAIKAILDSPDLRLDGFIGPGHVSTVIGCRPYEFIARDYGKPLVVAGFEPLDILQSVYMLHACSSPRAAPRWRTSTPGWCRGTATSRRCGVINEVMELRPYFEWRGLGLHLALGAAGCASEYAAFDAERLFEVPGVRVADPKACQCGEVLKGVLKPWECKVFGTACTPETPIGTCMVSLRGRLRGVLQLRPVHPRPREGGDRRMTSRRTAPRRRTSGTACTGTLTPSREQQVLDRIERARRRTARGARGAHHAGARRGRQGHPHPDRGGVPGGVPQPAARAAGGRGAARRRRRAAGLHHRLLRGVAAVLPRRRHRRPGRQRHRQRPGRCAGRGPLYLSAGFILEEGFPVADLRRIAASMAAAARAAGVQIVTGDTKVVQRGKADGCYITTAGRRRARAARPAGRRRASGRATR